jgi:putative ABC transport system permease protein
MAEFPILISQSAMELDEDTMRDMMAEMQSDEEDYVESDEVYLYNAEESRIMHTNVITEEYLEYLEEMDPAVRSNIGYMRVVGMNLLREVDGKVIPVSVSSDSSTSSGSTNISSMRNIGISSYPMEQEEGELPYLESKYDLLAGNYPKNSKEIVLVVDERNRVDRSVITQLGFDVTNEESITFDTLVGTELKLIPNNAYYQKTEFGTYLPGEDYAAMYEEEGAITITITAVVRQKESVSIGMLASGIAYSDTLVEEIIAREKDSDIVKAQEAVDFDIFTTEAISAEEKNARLMYFGGIDQPVMIMAYPKDFESKDKIVEYLDDYNKGKEKEDTVLYTDLASSISQMTNGIMDGITIVLIAFAAISLVVSMIMICIITYTSVLERTKEIGILKALGARKKDITRVFDAETLILGVFSGLLGVVIAGLLTLPINALLLRLTGLAGVATLRIDHALILVLISTVLTVLGGHIPARMASKRDAVEALRSE